MQAALLHSAADVPAEDWNRLGGGDPFASQEFLSAAEDSGAAAPPYGWQPLHLALRDTDSVAAPLCGLLPLYLRDHSFGDFSRDWNWSSAWREAGLDYYPKLVSGIPYTPSPGPRLMADDEAAPALAAAAIETAKALGASSWQCLFVQERDRAVLEAAGLLMRRGVQFHWFNRGYRDFADFLDGMAAAKRKKIKRERRGVAEAGLRFETLHGHEVDDRLWRAVYRHYRSTFLRYGNHPAFPLDFFRQAGAALRERMVVFIAWQDESPIASAICYRDDETLYGRHWGSDAELPGLHFELSYYQGIEYAVAHGLARFEAGAQGEHKLARGFEPTPTWSAFWIADGRMRAAVARYLAQEDEAMQDYQAETAARLPYKRVA